MQIVCMMLIQTTWNCWYGREQRLESMCDISGEINWTDMNLPGRLECILEILIKHQQVFCAPINENIQYRARQLYETHVTKRKTKLLSSDRRHFYAHNFRQRREKNSLKVNARWRWSEERVCEFFYFHIFYIFFSHFHRIFSHTLILVCGLFVVGVDTRNEELVIAIWTYR